MAAPKTNLVCHSVVCRVSVLSAFRSLGCACARSCVQAVQTDSAYLLQAKVVVFPLGEDPPLRLHLHALQLGLLTKPRL